MAREIKFRVWCPGGKKMYPNPIIKDGKPASWNFEETELRPWSTDGQVRLYGEPVLMQYTGLKDCNGKEIYEGDVVSDHIGVGVVRYAEVYAAFRVTYGNGQAKWFYDYNLKGEYQSIEVIGNIHENPELLEGAE